MNLDEKAHRCRVLWEKARNMYGSFFTELAEAQATMTPTEFDNWCYKSVGVSLKVAIRASDILRATDAARVKADLNSAARAAKEAANADLLDIKAKQTATKLEIEKNLTKIRDQQAINCKLKYEAQSAVVAEILSELANREAHGRLENGLAYLRLQHAVKSGAEGVDPETGRKWKWEKWATLAIGRPMTTIRESIQVAKNALSKSDGYPSFSGKALNGHNDSTVVDNIYNQATRQ